MITWNAILEDDSIYNSFNGITSSADGTKIATIIDGGQIYTSINSGSTWTLQNNSPDTEWSSIASSSNGSVIVATENTGYIYISTDSGISWSIAGNCPSTNWRSISSSADGTKFVAVAYNDYIYTSTNSGSTWVQKGTSGSWYAVATSSDCSIIIAGKVNGPIYVSTDSGTTWNSSVWNPENNLPYTLIYPIISCSSDGSLISVSSSLEYQSNIFISTTYGTSWTAKSPPNTQTYTWNTLNISADKSRIIAISGNNFYVSTDSGNTWNQITYNYQGLGITNLALSSNGINIVAIASDNYIYKSSLILQPSQVGTVSITPGNRSISLSWSPPLNNGGSSITGYKVEQSLNDSTWTTVSTIAQSPYNVTDLSNGILYYFRVSAINEKGAGSPSLSVSATPVISGTAPAQVGTVSTTIQDSSVLLSWSAPNNGGSSITGYKVEQSLNNSTWSIISTTASSPFNVSGLSNGILYYFRVSAINEIGTGIPSSSVSANPATFPSQIVTISSIIGNKAIKLSWSPPYNGGRIITGYKVDISSNNTWTELTTTASSYMVTSLINNIEHYFRVSAINEIGTGIPSSIISATPIDVPEQVGTVNAIGENQNVFLSWSPPNDGGNPIRSYKIEQSSDNYIWWTRITTTTDLSNITINNLTNGTLYYFRVSAINDLGPGFPSSPISVTPLTTPAEVNGITAVPDNNSLLLSWLAPNNGGSTISHYTIERSIDKFTWINSVTTSSLSYNIIDLSSGVYYFRISATNSKGLGQYGSIITVLIPTSNSDPLKIGSVSIVPGVFSLHINFVPPSSTNITGYEYRLYSGEQWISFSPELIGPKLSIFNLDTSTVYNLSIRTVTNSTYGTESEPISVSPISLFDIPSLIGYYSVQNINEESSNQLIDSSNKGNNFLIEGGVITTIEQRQAYRPKEFISGFSAQGASLTNVFYSNVNAITYATWIYLTNNTAPFAGILVENSGFTGLFVDSGKIRYMWKNIYWDYNTNITLPLNTWTHVALTVDNLSANFYINGILSHTVSNIHTEVSSWGGTFYMGIDRNIFDRGIQGALHGTTVLNSRLLDRDIYALYSLTTPSAPTNLSVVQTNTQSVLSYNAPTNLLGLTPTYVISTSPTTSVVQTSNLSTNISDLSLYTSYEYYVRTYTKVGRSNIASIIYPQSPSIPTIVSVDTNDRSLSINFISPSDPGSGTIVNYEYSIRTDNSISWTIRSPESGLSPIVISDLSNGIEYYVRLRAVNSFGIKSLGTDSVSAIPATVPGQVEIDDVSSGNNRVILFWLEPNSGGSTITDYRIDISSNIANSTIYTGSPSLSYDISGLRNGTLYEFRVFAINAKGTGSPSLEISAIPATVPGQVEIDDILSGNNSVLLSWSAPDNGGSTITAYRVELSTDNNNWLNLITDLLFSYTATNLESKIPHYFRVSAINGKGQGPSSSTVSAIPTTVPGQVETVNANVGDGHVLLSWLEADNGGSSITEYKIDISHNISGSILNSTIYTGSPSLSYDISGLTNGILYEFKVSAYNANGLGTPSSSIFGTPGIRPNQVGTVSIVPGNNKLIVSWLDPNNEDNGITGYDIEISLNDTNWTTQATDILSPYEIDDLRNGISYYVRVSARNIIGLGPVSLSVIGIPSTQPDKIESIDVYARYQSAILQWQSPYNGGNNIIGNRIDKYIGDDTWVTISTTAFSPYSVFDLSNGTTYYFRISAINERGQGLFSSSVNVTPLPFPDQVVITDVSAGDQTVLLNWSEPNDGGSPILEYKIDISYNGLTDIIYTGTTSLSYIKTNLTNGIVYSFRVSAISDIGQGLSSSPVLATPATLPAQITFITIEPKNKSVKLTWIPPDNGGSSITGYNVDISENNTWVTLNTTPTTTATTYTVSDLSNGILYYFRISAINEKGVGIVSLPVSATPANSPGQIGTINTSTGDQSITLSWSPPNDGGSSITGYKVDISLNNTWIELTRSASSPYEVSDLSNGILYYFRITAMNDIGLGILSLPVSAVPSTYPGQIDIDNIDAIPGDKKVSLSWLEPNDGGNSITSYKIDVSSNILNTSIYTNSPVLFYDVSDLSNGTLYDFRISAINVKGIGPSSLFVSATPALVPEQVEITDISAGNKSVTLSWSQPNNGGSSITGYRIDVSANGFNRLINTGPSTLFYDVSGLTNGNLYYFRVSAMNLVGMGPYSSSVSATPITVPSQIEQIRAIRRSETSLLLYWGVPNDGGSNISGYVLDISSTILNTMINIEGVLSTSYDISGLVPGVAYDFRVSAINNIGSGLQSLPVTIIPGKVPAKVENVSVFPKDKEVTLSWDAPNSGGNSISRYNVQISIDNVTWGVIGSSSSLSYDISGLENGEQYYFRISATNVIGTGETSTPISAIPSLVPEQAVLQSAQSGDKRVILSWSSPNNGGSPINNYKIDISSNISNYIIYTGSSGLSYNVTDLSNGILYEFRVSAMNPAGTGPSSLPLSSIPSTIPDQINAESILAIPSNQAILLSWSSPNDGGSGISGYEIDVSSNISRRTIYTGSSLESYNITDLSNGILHYFRISAINANGPGLWSLPISSKPATFPGQINLQTITTTPGNQSVLLSWSAPNNGGNDISDYKIDISSNEFNSTIYTGSALQSYNVSDLSNGVQYEFRISAINGFGTGPSSSPKLSFAGLVPGQIQTIEATPSDTIVELSWLAPNIGTSQIIGYKVERSINNNLWTLVSTTASSPYDVTDLSNGVLYYFRVSAISEIGTGSSSTPIQAIPRTYPNAPRITDISSNISSRSINIAFLPPINNGGAIITNYEYSIDTCENWITPDPPITLSPLTISDLSLNYTYLLKLRAVNIAGGGISTNGVSYSISTDSLTRPSVPKIISVIPDVSSINIGFNVPDSNGGIAITNYEYSIDVCENWITPNPPITQSPILVSGLVSGISYIIKIRAVNILGAGISTNGIPFQLPGISIVYPMAPTNFSVIPGNNSAGIWPNSESEDYQNITNFEYSTDNGISWIVRNPPGNKLPIYISGLTNGEEYTIKLRSINVLGKSLDSSGFTVIPNNIITSDLQQASNTLDSISILNATNIAIKDISQSTIFESTQYIYDLLSLISDKTNEIKSATMLSIAMQVPDTQNYLKEKINNRLIDLGIVTPNIAYQITDKTVVDQIINISEQYRISTWSPSTLSLFIPSEDILTIDLDNENMVVSFVPEKQYTVNAKFQNNTSINTFNIIYHRTSTTRYIEVNNIIRELGEAMTFIFSNDIKRDFRIFALGSVTGTSYPGGINPCIVKGTRVLTDSGYKEVENLNLKDLIITSDGRAVRYNRYSYNIENTTKENAPYLIKENAYGPGRPMYSIMVSPRHAIQINEEIWDLPLKSVNRNIEQVNIGKPVKYYHIELPNYFTDHLVCEGLVTESFGNDQVNNTIIYRYCSAVDAFIREK